MPNVTDPVFNLADVITDDSDGKQNIIASLANFASYLKKQNPGLTVKLQPFVYGSVLGVTDADLGISDELIEENDDSALVIIPEYPGMKAGDSIRILWGKTWLKTVKVAASDIGSYVVARINGSDVPKGKSSLKFRAVRGTTQTYASPSTITLYRAGQPGVDGVKGVGQELAAPSVTLPASKVIGPGEAKAKVKVTIAPYLSMHAGDKITLFWGDAVVEHVVTKAEVGKPVVILVDEAIIKAVGDSEELSVDYFVTDEVGNESEWSEDAIVHVQLEAKPLPQAPQVLDASGNVNSSGKIDLANLGSDHVPIQISGQFQAGDSIVLNWDGTTHAGQAIPLTYGPETLTKASEQLQFKVPFEVLNALVGGSVSLTYTLTRKGTQTTSKAAFINIEGEPVGLPEPVLNKDKNLDLWIEANHTVIHALIPIEAALKEEDEVVVKWLGTASDGKSVPLSSKMFRITKNRVGKVLPIQLRGDKFLKPFDGGWVDVNYEIKRGGQVFSSETVRYFVGNPAETLPAPFTEPSLAKNFLDPQLPDYEFDMQVLIPPTAPQPTPCTVTLYWATSEGGYYEDEQKLQQGDTVSPFLVPAEHLALNGDSPIKVWAYYVVEWEGKPSQASADFVFTIATGKMMDKLNGPLNIPSVTNDKLDLGKIPASGLVVEVPHYQDMAVGDKIRVKFGESVVKEVTVSTVGKQTITLTPAEISILAGKKNVVMTYEVERYPSGDKFTSQPVPVQLEGTFAKHPTYENFDTIPPGGFGINQPCDFPGLVARIDSGRAFCTSTSHPNWRPVRGGQILTDRGAKVSFLLKTPARRITFDIASGNRTPGVVNFYDSDGTLIGSNKTPLYTSRPAAGYTIASTKVSYVSAGKLISRVQYVDGGGLTYIDNFVWSAT